MMLRGTVDIIRIRQSGPSWSRRNAHDAGGSAVHDIQVDRTSKKHVVAPAGHPSKVAYGAGPQAMHQGSQ
jgi:hypothetical protein